MTPTEFLRNRNIIAKNKSDLMIGFDNGTEESLIELLETYHKNELKEAKENGNDLLDIVINRFDIKQQDIYKINGIIRKHIKDASSGFYTNSEDEKNHIRWTLYDIVEVALNGL